MDDKEANTAKAYLSLYEKNWDVCNPILFLRNSIHKLLNLEKH